MIVFTVKQLAQLHNGKPVEKTYPVVIGRAGDDDPCPFVSGMVYACRKDGSRAASFQVVASDVARVKLPTGDDWRVRFVKHSAVPWVPRLLGMKGGYTDDPKKALGNGTEHDPGEAIPLDRDADDLAAHALTVRRAAVDRMRELAPHLGAYHARQIGRILDAAERDVAA